MKRKSILYLLMIFWVLQLTACSGNDVRRSVSQDVRDFFTLKTVTMPALATARPTRTHTPTVTPNVTATATPAPSATPTAVPIVSPTPFSVDISQMSLSANEKLQLISDVTIPDGTVFEPNQMFIKSWRVRNTGETDWNNGYQLLVAYTSPFRSPPLSHAIFIQPTDLIDFSISTWGPRQYNVGKNDTVDLVIPLQAPAQPGDYVAEFYLVNAEGALLSPKIWIQFSVELLPDQAAATEQAAAALSATPDVSEAEPVMGTIIPTIAPIDWTGTWLIRDPDSETQMIPRQAWLTQTGTEVFGFYYDADGEPVLIEGVIKNNGQVLTGRFAQPWQNKATPFEWRLLANRNQFYSVTAGGVTGVGSVCGGRNGLKFPEHCSLPSGD